MFRPSETENNLVLTAEGKLFHPDFHKVDSSFVTGPLHQGVNDEFAKNVILNCVLGKKIDWSALEN